MLAFRMKKPSNSVKLDAVEGKIDRSKWDAEAVDLVRHCGGMRQQVKEACESYNIKGAEECMRLMSKYQVVLAQVEHVCGGVSLSEARVTFEWLDAFDESTKASEPSLSFERAAVLFNLAAATSFHSNSIDRQAEGGVKLACHLYQKAAGALEACAQLVRSAAWASSADLATDTLGVLTSLMLAQAQKCMMEKATADGLKAGVLAKLAAECAGLYDEVARGFDEAKARGRPISKMSDGWLKVVHYNRDMWDGMQHFYLGKTHEDGREFGQALSRFTYATNKTAEAVNACADAAPALQEQFKAAHAKCREAYNAMKRDNDLVHYEKVPDLNTLPKPARTCLVKALLPEPVALPTQKVAETKPAAAVPPPPPPAMPFEEAQEAAIKQLVTMGFGKEQATEALAKNGGSIQAATEDLLTLQ